MRTVRNIIFDLDGTLADSAGDIRASLRRAASETLGVKGDFAVPDYALGLPLKEALAASVPGIGEADSLRVCARFREIYDSSEYPLTRLMPGVMSSLSQLSVAGMVLLVATNKPAKPAGRILRKLGIDGFFSEVCSPDSLQGERLSKARMIELLLSSNKLDRSSALMVGDSEQDILAARDAGIGCAYLLSGYGGADGILKEKPDFILQTIEDLRGII